MSELDHMSFSQAEAIITKSSNHQIIKLTHHPIKDERTSNNRYFF